MGIRILQEWEVNLITNPLVYTGITRVAHYSYDGPRLPSPKQPTTDRILVREELPCNRFVDDCDSRRTLAICGSELSPGAHLHAHRLKVVGADVVYCYSWPCSRLKRRTSYDEPRKKTGFGWRGKRKEIGQAGRLDAGQSLDARERFL